MRDYRRQLTNMLSRSPRKRLARELPPGAIIADVGSGVMWKSYLYVFLPRGDARVIGFERLSGSGNEILPEHIRRTNRFDLRSCDLEREPIPLDSGSVDGVFFSHVIEHVKNKDEVVAEIARILKPGGFLYVETPGPRSTIVPKASRLFRPGDPYPYHYEDDPEHVGAPLTSPQLADLLERHGLQIQEAGYHREFGRLAIPLYAAMFVAGFLPILPRRTRTALRGFGWWNMIGWPIYAFCVKPDAKQMRGNS